jgi:hypothetical protein
LALSVPLSRFTSRVGGGSAFYVRPLAHAMKLSRPFWIVIVGAAMCLAGTAGIYYFLLFPEYWNSSRFWSWNPVIVIAVCLGIILIFAALIFGLVSGLIAHFRRRKVESR